MYSRQLEQLSRFYLHFKDNLHRLQPEASQSKHRVFETMDNSTAQWARSKIYVCEKFYLARVETETFTSSDAWSTNYNVLPIEHMLRISQNNFT